MYNTFIADFLYSKELLSLELFYQIKTTKKLSETIKFDQRIDISARDWLKFSIQSHSNFQQQYWLSRFRKVSTEHRELIQNQPLHDYFSAMFCLSLRHRPICRLRFGVFHICLKIISAATLLHSKSEEKRNTNFQIRKSGFS